MPMDLMLFGLLFAAIFAGVFLAIQGAWTLSAHHKKIAQRLDVRAGALERDVPAPKANLIEDDGALRTFARFVSPQNEKDLTTIRQRMIRAGRRNQAAVRWHYLQKGIFGLASALVAVAYGIVFLGHLQPYVLVAMVLGATVIGMLIPSFLLSRAIETRRETMRYDFPDAVDMLLVCVEAGMGLDQALGRLAKELIHSRPVLAEEFGVVCAELRAGKDRAQVLRDLADRTEIDDIGALVTVLNQSAEYGVSIAESLRVFSAEMRYKRMMRAEETANAMPIKLAMGSVLFTIPPVGILLAGPSVAMMMNSFSSMG